MTAVDEKVEAEKLRQVRALIEDVLREHDVLGSVVLAGRAGRFENFQHVGASWSNLRLQQFPDGSCFLGVSSHKADYVGRLDEQKLHLAWSVGVLGGFGRLLGVAAMQFLETAERIEAAVGAESAPWERDDPRDEPGLP